MSFEYWTTTPEGQRGITVLSMKGSIDSTTSVEVEEALATLFAGENRAVVVDLSQVPYISSAGWRVFIVNLKGLRDHQERLKIAGMQQSVTDVFKLLGFDHILETYDGVNQAVEAFQKQSVQGG